MPQATRHTHKCRLESEREEEEEEAINETTNYYNCTACIIVATEVLPTISIRAVGGGAAGWYGAGVEAAGSIS